MLTVKGEVIHSDALFQADWYINSASGNDGNSGASGSPLKTIGEYNRRIGDGVVAPIYSYVYLSGDFDEGSYFFHGKYPNVVWVQGERTVLGTGTISAVQQWDATTSKDGQIEDDSLAVSWTDSGFVGNMIVLTTGANAGAVAWIGKDLGAKTARHSPFSQLMGVTLVHPTIGDEYEIVSLTKITGSFTVEVGGIFVFQDCELALVANAVGNGLTTNIGNQLYLSGCAVTAAAYCANAHNGGTVLLDCSKFAVGASEWGGNDGAQLMFRFGLVGSRLSVVNSFLLCENALFQGGIGSGTIRIFLYLNAAFRSYEGVIGYYDGGASDYCLKLHGCSVAEFLHGSKIFGTGNAGTCFIVAAGSSVLFPDGDNATDHFDVSTTGVEARIGSIDKTYAEIGLTGFVNLTNLAMITPSEW